MKSEIRTYLQVSAGLHQNDSKLAAEVDDEVVEDFGELLLDSRLATADRLGLNSLVEGILIVRIAGDQVQEGWLEQVIQEDVLAPFVKEVEAAAPSKAREDVRLGLVGVSAGSVVLHYRPHRELVPSEPNHLNIPVSAAESAILRMSDLHAALEIETSADEIGSRFGNSGSFLKQTRRLVEGLSKYDLTMSTRWLGQSNSSKKSMLTSRGQAHGLRIFQSLESNESVQVQGMVTALDIDGTVTITGASGQKYKLVILPDRIRDPAFGLGVRVHVRAYKEQPVDSVGVLHGRAIYKFIEHISDTPFDLGGL